MLDRFERQFGPIRERLVVLAPFHADPTGLFANVERSERHKEFVRSLQRLRGQVYLEDGAIERRQLSVDGLHQTPEDKNSWHLLMLDGEGRVTACAWYLEHTAAVTVNHLRVRDCPLARRGPRRQALWSAVGAEIAHAKRERLNYVEVGGWAVAQEHRGTPEGLILALAGYSLGRIRGGCLGITTATVRHCSSTILRRLGGVELEFQGRALPAYYDPRYRCEMEILRFDSRRPNARYGEIIDVLSGRLADSLVISDSETSPVVIPDLQPPPVMIPALTSPVMALAS